MTKSNHLKECKRCEEYYRGTQHSKICEKCKLPRKPYGTTKNN